VLALIAVALAVFAILIEPAGFIIASAALFTISSTAMGSRKIGMNAVIGIVLATIIYVGFDIWLGVRLPGGITESIFN
jgi:putative tricarboxylic transport membrane protein